MRKIPTMFLFLFAIGLIFAGTVSAQEVSVSVEDQNGNPAVQVTEGDKVNLVGESSTDQAITNPCIWITVDPTNGLKYDTNNAMMTYKGNSYTNDPNLPFFYDASSATESGYYWYIGRYGSMNPGDLAQLTVPATVTATGELSVDADLYDYPQEMRWIFLNSSSFSFRAVAAPVPTEQVKSGTVAGATVGMQKTGIPLVGLVFAVLVVIGGFISSKK